MFLLVLSAAYNTNDLTKRAWAEPDFAAQVHRGIYEAARILYDIFLPMVEEHLASSPFAKLVFTVRLKLPFSLGC